RELPCEDGEVLRLDALADRARLRLGLVFLLRLGLGRRDPRDLDLLAAQRGDGGVHRIGDAFPADGLAGAGPSGVSECRHKTVLSRQSSVVSPQRATGGRAVGAPGRPSPAPATTPTPRLIMSCSSSRFEEADIAVSSVIVRFMYRLASDWFIVCIPSFS